MPGGEWDKRWSVISYGMTLLRIGSSLNSVVRHLQQLYLLSWIYQLALAFALSYSVEMLVPWPKLLGGWESLWFLDYSPIFALG